MASRNNPSGVPGQARPPNWSSHLRQFSRNSLERIPDMPRSPDTVSSSSTIRDRPSSSSRRSRIDKRWTVTVNESFARDEVLLNLDLIGDEAKPGSLMAIDVFRPDSEKQTQGSHHHHHHHHKQPPLDRTKEAAESQPRYIFVVKGMPKELKARYPSVEVYVAKHIADVFGMRKGSQVTLTPIDDQNPAIEASHVELCFRDQYMSRSDMWQLAARELSDRTVYKGQMVLFMGTLKAQVTAVYVDGRKVPSAFFGHNTKPIFRSESARYVLFVQMAREMWDFDSDGSGEIMFNKVVNGFLPALFKKWASLKVRHLVTIVLFARVEYDTGISTEFANPEIQNDYYTGVQSSGDRRPYKDFYRVVVSEMGSGEWTKILYQLKREFNYFRRDISTFHQKAMHSFSSSDDPADQQAALNRIKAEASRAIYGNFLEAINMASSLFAHDYIDRDLMRTGISVIVISPSPGIFEVEYDALRRTTESLVGNGIGIDLICIPKTPLHSVPLFRYRNPEYSTEPTQHHKAKTVPSLSSTPKQTAPTIGSYNSMVGSYSPSRGTDITLRGDYAGSGSAQDEWNYALPQWLHVSYWTGESEETLSYHGIALSVSDVSQTQSGDDFLIRCRMYDLQMRSVMETNEIETKPLHLDPYFPHKALQASNVPKPYIDQDGNVFIQNSRIPEILFDHVYGFQKFAPDKHAKLGEKSLWKQLQDYDDSRARQPSLRRTLAPLRHVREYDDSVRRHHADDASLLGTSYTERRPSTSASQMTITGHGSGQRFNTDKPELRARKTVDFDKLNSKRSPTTTPKVPKFMKQISLGSSGFRIAAPKAATAELSIESVNADRSLTSSRALMNANTAATPAKAVINRSMSPQMFTSGTPAFSPWGPTPGSFAPGHQYFEGTPSRPMPIKSQQLPTDPSANMLSGSMLASTLRADYVPDNRDFLYSDAIRAEDAKKVYNNKLLAGAVPELPSTLSPTTALSPWLTLVNPSNPDSNKVDIVTLYSRWQHVFPRPNETRVMKWKSLCSPAAVPLTTEYFPTKAQFESEYHRQPYNVSQNADDELAEELKSRDEMLREMISLRFCQGFQVVVGPAVAKAFGQKQLKVTDIFSRDHTAEDGTSIFMSVGNTIHQLSCVNGTEIEVNIFVRKPIASPELYDDRYLYKPAIRTLLDHGYKTLPFDMVAPTPDRNWNYVDAFVAGHNDELSEHLRFWRARFVLIPMTARHSFFPKTQYGDSEEEIRIEGIRKLAQMWQKHRYIPASERSFQAARRKKDLNPLDIVYKTEDPSVVIAAELETLPLFEGLEGGHKKGQLVTSREQFSKKNFSLAALAEAIQQPVETGGIRMQNRRWHLRLHYNCFIGSDMTTWLLEHFEDLEDREEAEELGNRLMVSSDDKSRDENKDGRKDGGGLFVHVERRHPFRDGQYFYQISSDYAKPNPPGWFNTRRAPVSVPSTPRSEARDSPRSNVSMSRPTSIHEDSSPTSGTVTPTAATMAGGKKPRVVLSKVMKYDVDHRKRSYRPEVVELHYDRLHNPDNCYHIRIDWMNVTAKLIEDAIEAWAREAALYGLRLVEVPIAEACDITEINPFRRPYVIKLVVQPPNQQPITYFDPNSFIPQAQPGRHFYQRALLRKFDFVLDLEPASSFPYNVDVSYSWGKPDFKYTQFIHRCGTLIAEITDEGDILILANRLYSNRTAAQREKEMQQKGGGGGAGSDNLGPGPGPGRIPTPSLYGPNAHPGDQPTAVSSPLVKPTTAFLSPALRPHLIGPMASGPPSTNGFGITGQSLNRSTITIPVTPMSQDPEVIKDELESFCRDRSALEAFYREVLEREVHPPAPYTTPGLAPVTVLSTTATKDSTRAFGTPHTTSTSTGHIVPDTNIPTFGLPPGVLAATGGTGLSNLSDLQLVGSGTGLGISPVRVGSPRLLSAASAASAGHPSHQMRLRRASVQEGVMGSRIGLGIGGGASAAAAAAAAAAGATAAGVNIGGGKNGDGAGEDINKEQ
ncbi:hypothetical protein QBC45DRAFT_228926 [Copromyces sp. CBS 386.78]|nr:hypothetical protein QBC45DRAFT_228926 [Copromyces sp. CBS 386.78]